ncbi:MAG: hypothetical protein CL402_00865 [Acidiferrobacteraceae bacterium]|nr:hypothetical protein [Acidiferrobacteraceae bacterium]|tara:strand:- start:5307 stop:6998 length:1692 start_codon:yes stop_codon:yes gene_type:complete
MSEKEMRKELDHLVSDYHQGKLNRRQFMKRAAAVGVTASAAGSLLISGSSAVQAAGHAKKGGTLREGYDLDFSKHDPITTNWYDPAFFAIYEAILTNDPDGGDAPQLATGFSVSDDGMQYRFDIDPNRTFHSGKPANAAAVADYLATFKSLAFIATLAAAVDNYTSEGDQLVINMKNPWVGTLGPHKTGYFRISCTDTWREAGGDTANSTFGTEIADGTGPFTHEEWVPGSHVLVKRWEDYPGSNTPWFENRGKAHLDAVRWTFIPEASQRAVQLENGDIDTLKGPAPQDVSRLESNPDITVYRFPEWSGYILTLNQDHSELFGDVRVRKAIAHLIDREAIRDFVFFGDAVATPGPLPSTDRTYDPIVEDLISYNVDGAAALMTEAGWSLNGDGIWEKDGTVMSFEFVAQAESINEAVATAVSAMLREGGFEAQVNMADRAVTFEKQSAQGRDAAPMTLFFWLWPIPIDVLNLFVNSVTIPFPNMSRAAVPAIDAAMTAWQTAGTNEEGQAAATAFQKAYCEEVPYVSLVTKNAVFAKRNNVHGWQPTLWNLYPYYNDVWIDS